MEWLSVELVVAVLGVIGTVLGMIGKAKYGKVIEALVKAIETEDAKPVKTAAKANSVTNGSNALLSALVAKLTGGLK